MNYKNTNIKEPKIEDKDLYRESIRMYDDKIKNCKFLIPIFTALVCVLSVTAGFCFVSGSIAGGALHAILEVYFVADLVSTVDDYKMSKKQKDNVQDLINKLEQK